MTNSDILTAHHLPYAVVNILEKAQQYAVLTTAYLRSWLHLDHTIRTAVKRGVRVHLVIRTPDGSNRDRVKTRAEIDKFANAGVTVHPVERLHAKVYLNESEAIVTSFNLVMESHESHEIGVRFTDPQVVGDFFEALLGFAPGLEEARSKEARTETPSQLEKQAARSATAFCIGCSDELPRNPRRPLCRSCYSRSDGGYRCEELSKRVCHLCGKPHPGTLERPLCRECYRALPVNQRTTRKQARRGTA